MNAILTTTTALFALLSTGLLASSLDEARVNRVVNEVAVAAPGGKPRPAVERETLHPGDAARTGPQSRVELLFTDGTLARLGAETELAARRGTRELDLARGTLLLEVPAFRGGARVRIGALSAVCGRATILIEHLPAQSVKLVVLEGDLRVATAGLLGDSIVIPPGKMLITGPDVKLIPDPVDVDLATLVKTSALVDPATFATGAAPLASLPRIQKEIARQAKSIKVRRLIPTNLTIVGSGTNIVIPSAPAVAAPAVSDGESAGRGNERTPSESAKIAQHHGISDFASKENSLLEP